MTIDVTAPLLPRHRDAAAEARITSRYRFSPDDPTANPPRPMIWLGWRDRMKGEGDGSVLTAGDDGWRYVVSMATAAAAAAVKR